jgi:hypothetical protein
MIIMEIMNYEDMIKMKTYGDLFYMRADKYVIKKILDDLNGVNKYDWTNITNKFSELKKKPSDYTLTDYNEYVPDPKAICPYNILPYIDIIIKNELGKLIILDSVIMPTQVR